MKIRLGAVVAAGLLAWQAFGLASEPPNATRQQVAQLEARLFEPVLSVGQVDRLLEELKTPATRAAAAGQLAEKGQGHIDAIIRFARACPDVEARQACAEVVAALDASYRTTPLGRQLGALYREHTEALLPAYWARFRKDPLDLRAVAMLMHGDPEKVYAALGKGHDRHDPLRYLLLRMRELTPDDFARRHLYEHTLSGVRLVGPDVFPTGGYHRVVGHVARTSLQLGGVPNPPPGLPKIGYCNVCPQTVYVYKYRSAFRSGRVSCATLEMGRWGYGKDGVSQSARVVRSIAGWTEQVCDLTELKLSQEQQLAWAVNNGPAPWWAAPYVPPAYRKRVACRPRPQGAIAPEEVRPAPTAGGLAPRPGVVPAKVDPAAPSVVFLPPRVPAPASRLQAAAELACDRLAQELAAAGIARVVDRAQVDRILAERAMDPKAIRPLVSYDAMVRLEIDTSRMLPAATVSLVDLSTGNVLGQETFGWPLKESDVGPMLALCRSALRGVVKPAVGKLRVRALWPDRAIVNERIAPLGRRLVEVFHESLRRSDRIVLVHHLEAATAKEESLLLLMGLSRLPGARQFSPQADATIELRVVEGDGRGKTFPETPVQIGVRLRKGAGFEGDWVTTEGLVRDFDALLPRAWQKLAGSLGEARPETAARLLDEMSLRRKQAAAEVQAAADLEKAAGTRRDKARLEAYRAQLAHAEAAVKLDPTYPEAADAYVRALYQVSYFDWKEPKQVPDAPLRTLREAARYAGRFPHNAKLCGSLCSSAIYGLYRSPLNRLYGLVDGAEPLAPVRKGTLVLTPELVEGLEAVKQLLERGLEDDVALRFDSAERMVAVTYHGMESLDVPPAERQAWLERVLRRAGEKIKRVEKTSHFPDSEWNEYLRMKIRIAELFMEDGCMDRAKQIVAQVPAEMAVRYGAWSSVTQLMRAVAVKTDDARLLAELNRLIDRKKGQRVGLLWIEWPKVDVFAGKKDLDSVYVDKGRSRLQVVEVRARRPPEYHFLPRHQALAEGGGRLYFLVSHARTVVAYVPLDDQGRPIGHAVRGQSDRPMWDNVRSIPQPKVKKDLSVEVARYLDGKLYLGTRRDGLLVFDLKAETWKRYGPEQGLPSSSVERFFPLGDRRLYGASRTGHFTLDLESGAVTLLHRGDEQHRQYVDSRLELLWRDGTRVMGLGTYGTWTDLLAAEPAYSRLPRTTCYGWHLGESPHLGAFTAAEADGRRFYLCRGGLYEIDAAGKTLRTWWRRYRLQPAGGGLGVNTGLDVVAPADCPIVDLPQLYACGPRLVFADHQRLTVFDPKTDTWYGPVAASGCEVTLTTPGGGLWGKISPSDGLFYLPLDNLLEYARSAGRVVTTDEYRRRKEQLVEAAAPLDRGKLNLGMRRFDKAKAAFAQVLDADPNQPEALLLMGLLHDRNGLRRPDEAIEYYRRAADLKDNGNASYSGMYLWACVLKDGNRWPETVELCERILRRYPGLGRRPRENIQWLRDHARKQAGAKQAAAAK